MRLRKAWGITVDGWEDRPDADEDDDEDVDKLDIYYAPNAGKARMDAWRNLSDFSRIPLIDIRVRRLKAKDVLLPDRDPIADQMTEKQAHCLLHAFGGNDDPYKAGFRDYFFTDIDDPDLVALEKLGLMSAIKQRSLFSRMVYFRLTERGKHVALSIIRVYK